MLSDEEILERGGTQEDIDAYAHDVGGACGKAYGGQCDQCDKLMSKPTLDDILEDLANHYEHTNDSLWVASNGEYTVSEAKQALLGLIKEETTKARIDELKQAAIHINRGQGWEDYIDRAIEQLTESETNDE